MTTIAGRLVYIDDDEEMLELVKAILVQHGYSVEGASGGREGLELVRHALPDLVLLDLMMPDMDGWDVYQHLKADESTRDIPVIILTAKVQNLDKTLGLSIAKVEGYIAKPFSPHELVEQIQTVLAGRHSPSSSS